MDTNKMRELKELAEAAGSYEWYAAGDLRYCDDKTGETHGLHHDDGRFIAAASPAAILALLAEIERLKAENEDYKSGQDRYEQIIEDLKAENEALRKDAKRYRFLRNQPGPWRSLLWFATQRSRSSLAMTALAVIAWISRSMAR